MLMGCTIYILQDEVSRSRKVLPGWFTGSSCSVEEVRQRGGLAQAQTDGPAGGETRRRVHEQAIRYLQLRGGVRLLERVPPLVRVRMLQPRVRVRMVQRVGGAHRHHHPRSAVAAHSLRRMGLRYAAQGPRASAGLHGRRILRHVHSMMGHLVRAHVMCVRLQGRVHWLSLHGLVRRDVRLPVHWHAALQGRGPPAHVLGGQRLVRDHRLVDGLTEGLHLHGMGHDGLPHARLRRRGGGWPCVPNCVGHNRGTCNLSCTQRASRHRPNGLLALCR
mmetsp:Transcript_24616/g.53705  ORF Transcript_24616/g.53705 Transcript_24616/m.53705 type:complete len:275 (-) Transcript_24616:812-1636(-)